MTVSLSGTNLHRRRISSSSGLSNKPFSLRDANAHGRNRAATLAAAGSDGTTRSYNDRTLSLAGEVASFYERHIRQSGVEPQDRRTKMCWTADGFRQHASVSIAKSPGGSDATKSLWRAAASSNAVVTSSP